MASNDSAKGGEKKRERETKKKYMSIPHYDRRA